MACAELPVDGSTVKLKGLPFKASPEEVCAFFAGMTLGNDKVFLKRHPDGRPNGEVRACNACAMPDASRSPQYVRACGVCGTRHGYSRDKSRIRGMLFVATAHRCAAPAARSTYQNQRCQRSRAMRWPLCRGSRPAAVAGVGDLGGPVSNRARQRGGVRARSEPRGQAKGAVGRALLALTLSPRFNEHKHVQACTARCRHLSCSSRRPRRGAPFRRTVRRSAPSSASDTSACTRRWIATWQTCRPQCSSNLWCPWCAAGCRASQRQRRREGGERE
eukprot:364536-Chlamydomonas_euryale.AAC.7